MPEKMHRLGIWGSPPPGSHPAHFSLFPLILSVPGEGPISSPLLLRRPLDGNSLRTVVFYLWMNLDPRNRELRMLGGTYELWTLQL